MCSDEGRAVRRGAAAAAGGICGSGVSNSDKDFDPSHGKIEGTGHLKETPGHSIQKSQKA